MQIRQMLLSDKSIKVDFKYLIISCIVLIIAVILLSYLLRNYLLFQVSSFLILTFISFFVIKNTLTYEKTISILNEIHLEQQNKIKEIEIEKTQLNENRETIEKYKSAIIERLKIIQQNKELWDLYLSENEN